MTLSRGLCVEPVAVCWICRKPLEFVTDGDGHLVEVCTPCRLKIETLQRRTGLRLFWRAPVPEPVVEFVRIQCKHDPETIKRAREIARREGLVVAARRTGVKYATLWWHAREAGWRVMSGHALRTRAVEQRRVS